MLGSLLLFCCRCWLFLKRLFIIYTFTSLLAIFYCSIAPPIYYYVLLSINPILNICLVNIHNFNRIISTTETTYTTARQWPKIATINPFYSFCLAKATLPPTDFELFFLIFITASESLIYDSIRGGIRCIE